MPNNKQFAGIFLIICVLFYGPSAWAVGSGGYENASFSSVSLAQGNAVVAQGNEPAAISYNPAAIVDLPGVQFQQNSGFISMFTSYESDTQPNMRSSGTLSYIPPTYVTINPGHTLNDRLALGVGIDAPFGLKNKYDSTHPAVRYTMGASNEIKMMALKPILAVRITDKLSLGAGPVWYRLDNLGTISQYPNFSIVPGARDGQIRLNSSGSRWGWQAAAKYKVNESHQLGFYFRSPTVINARGQIEVENPVLAETIHVGARAKLSIPMNFTVAYAFRPNDKSVIEADLGWTKWSINSRINVHADPVTTGANAVINGAHDTLINSLGTGPTDYRDTFSLNLGGSYDVTDKLTLRGGGFFYWTPLPKNHFRPNLPDANSISFSYGLSYKVFDNLDLDLAHLHRFWFTRHVDNDISEALGTSVDGKYSSYAQEFMASIRYMWDAFGDAKKEEPEIEVQEEQKKMVKRTWENAT